MDKQKIKSILDNAPEGATHISSNGVFYSVSSIDGYTPLTWWVRGEEWIDTGVHHITQSLPDLRAQLALIEENEKLKAALLTVANWQDSDKEQVGFCIEVLKELSND